MARMKCTAVTAVLIVAFAVVKANQCVSGDECPAEVDNLDNVVSLLQTKLQINAVAGKRGREACTNLLNKYSHFAVEVAVGTPPQRFEAVADTGSDALIVPSCLCFEKGGGCDEKDHCFRGTNKSSSFLLTKENDQVQGVTMTFGSGPITAVIASDVVEVGGLTAKMNDGLLLMVDRNGLKIDGPFEGILGLGPPKPSNAAADSEQGGSNDGHKQLETKRFLNEAGIERFSICFNDGDKPGVLRMNVPEFETTLPAIGTAHHWAFGLYGVSVGHDAESAPAILCTPSDANRGKKTPCGAIPDSGTTLLTAPKAQVVTLFASLCDNWERCRTEREGKLKNESKAHAFQMLVHGCNDWMQDDDNGIDEIPSIFFAVGSPSNPQKVEVTAWAYIVETVEEEVDEQIRYLMGVVPVVIRQPTGKNTKVCVPRIGVEDFITDDNGPVWLLGTPLFYQYTVGYDMTGKGISLKKGDCNECGAGPSLIAGEEKLVKRARRVRTATEPPRVRKIDKSLPL